jgi:hypothetical protein
MRKSAWASSSTPSATTDMCSESAMPRIAEAIATFSWWSGRPFTKDRSILSLEIGKRLTSASDE